MTTALAQRKVRALVNRTPLMRLQDLFDEVVWAARTSDYARSLGARESCMYRGDNGARCLVGGLIGDNEYRPDMEGCTPRELRERMGLFADFTDDMMSLLDEFQGIHDDEFGDDWEFAFEGLAESMGLEYSAPGE